MIFIVFLMIFILFFNDFLQNWCKTNCNVFHCFFNGFYWFSLFFNIFRWFLDQFCFFYWFFNDFHYFSTFFIDFLMIFFLFKPTYFSSWEKKLEFFLQRACKNISSRTSATDWIFRSFWELIESPYDRTGDLGLILIHFVMCFIDFLMIWIDFYCLFNVFHWFSNEFYVFLLIFKWFSLFF